PHRLRPLLVGLHRRRRLARRSGDRDRDRRDRSACRERHRRVVGDAARGRGRPLRLVAARYFPTVRIGALSTTRESWITSLPFFASAVIWSSLTSRTGVTPGFHVTKSSFHNGL